MSGVNEQIRLVPISRIDIVVQARPLNDAHVKRLKQSIHDEGLKNPIVVYERGERFALGPGRHRLQAYVEMEFHEIPAIVRPDAPDEVIRREQMIENLQRENMTPIEEARALEKLNEEIQNLDQLAVIAGKSRKWVEQRLSFMRLSPRVQHLIDVGRLPIEHGYQIARVASPERQEEIAGMVAAAGEDDKDGYRLDERAAELDDVKDLVEDSLRDLNGVQWKLDAEFEGLPACVTCPHNSANQPTLFDTKEKIHKCLEPGCFSQKFKLASSGVRKASNYINKEDLAATPKNAETAIAAREVTFVDPKAVAEYARTVKAPSKKTKSESAGRAKAQDDTAARHLFNQKIRDWKQDLDRKISAKLRKDKIAVAMFLLLKMTDDYEALDNSTGSEFTETEGGKKSPKLAALEMAVGKLVDLLKAPSAAALAKIAGKIEDTKESDYPLPWSMPSAVRVRLCEVFGIEYTAKPTFEQVKAELKAKEAEPKGAGIPPAKAEARKRLDNLLNNPKPPKAPKKKTAAKKKASKKK